jgi:tRNA-Thr(GGU) m(6)t(6)A37 methyltransferase TsaA
LDQADSALVLDTIGIIRTPHFSASGAPIQGRYAEGAEGVVELRPEFAEGLKDIEGFERIWLIYAFDRASSAGLVVRPYLDDREHGVFATRAPARPNPIGISCVRLLRVEGSRLCVADVDMLDMTPLLDIKPYVPAFDSVSTARIGWMEMKIGTITAADARFIRNT